MANISGRHVAYECGDSRPSRAHHGTRRTAGPAPVCVATCRITGRVGRGRVRSGGSGRGRGSATASRPSPARRRTAACCGTLHAACGQRAAPLPGPGCCFTTPPHGRRRLWAAERRTMGRYGVFLGKEPVHGARQSGAHGSPSETPPPRGDRVRSVRAGRQRDGRYLSEPRDNYRRSLPPAPGIGSSEGQSGRFVHSIPSG